VPHPLYLQLHFLGAVERLEAMAFSPKGGDKVEELRVLMQGQGRTGSLTISMNASPMMNTLKLCGSRMTVEVNLNNMTIVKRRDYKVPKIIAKPLPNLDESWQLVSQTARTTVDFVRGKVRFYPGMGELIRRFYDAIRRGTPPPVSESEATAVVDVTARIWEAVGVQAAKSPPAPALKAATRTRVTQGHFGDRNRARRRRGGVRDRGQDGRARRCRRQRRGCRASGVGRLKCAHS
jgi:predicted dehydrogenase